MTARLLQVLLRILGLTAIYLLVLTSLAPGDIVVGGLLATALVLPVAVHVRHGPAHRLRRMRAFARVVALTTADIVVGSARVVRFCLGGDGRPGFVEIPRGDRSRHGVALWGVLVGESPDEYAVAVDDARDVLIVHLVDARDPDAIRARHAARERDERDVVP